MFLLSFPNLFTPRGLFQA